MNGTDYQRKAARTINQELTRRECIDHAVLGINSEAGEIAGIFQKGYQGHAIDAEHIKKECGDLMWFVAELGTAIGFDFDDVMETNIEKLKKRYRNGFTAEESLHRAKGDI